MTFRKALNHEDGRGCCDQRAQAGSERAAIRDFEVAFAPADAHVRLMRRITLAHLRLWGLTALNDTATLAVSELVTNAVRYCHGSEIGLRIVSSAEELRIEVTDGNPTPAQRREVDAEAENGRGLWLVAALAKEWGVSSDGMMTWCCLALPPADARAVEAPMVLTAEPESRRSVGTGERPAPAPKTDRTLLSVGTPLNSRRVAAAYLPKVCARLRLGGPHPVIVRFPVLTAFSLRHRRAAAVFRALVPPAGGGGCDARC